METKNRNRIITLVMALGLVTLPFLLGMLSSGDKKGEADPLQASIAVGHETRDLNVRPIVLFMIALLVMGGVALIVSTGTMAFFANGNLSFHYPPDGLQNAPIPTLPPEPRLEDVPGETLDAVRREEDQLLSSYGWVDEKSGVVHIPIDRAMELLLQEGLPSRPAGSARFQDQGDQSPSDPSSGRMMDKYP